MLRKRWMTALPLLLLTALAVPQLGAAEIRDRAGMFSADAIRKAQAEFDRIERTTSVPVVIETITAISGLESGASATEKRRAIEVLAEKKAREIGYEGVYLLISKNDHVFSEPLVKKRFESQLPKERRGAVRDALVSEFKNGNFDAGLVKAAGILAESLSETPVVAPRRAIPGVPAQRRGDAGKFGLGSLLVIGLGIFGVLLLFRVLGGLFNRGGGYSAPMGMGGMRPGMGPGPGYGAPGYGYGGPRGGGFFSGMLGGLGGALAGNWLYDQFSGRHGGAGHVDAGAYTSGEGAEHPDQGGDAFVGGDDDGGQGTSWADPGGDPSGGGDWGGGDGGGDWGGGGGDWGSGDWGGGGGDGGGW